jgi:hypothetical protein
MKITITSKRKPRNHLVAHVHMRNGSGAHVKSEKAKRRAGKMMLVKDFAFRGEALR